MHYSLIVFYSFVFVIHQKFLFFSSFILRGWRGNRGKNMVQRTFEKFILYYRNGNVEIRGKKKKRCKNQMKYENGRRKR